MSPLVVLCVLVNVCLTSAQVCAFLYSTVDLHTTPTDALYSLFISTSVTSSSSPPTLSILQSIDLSSLQQIQYGGYVLGNNPQLCYVGNFSRYLTDNTSTVCTSTSIVPRRDPVACSKSARWVVYVVPCFDPASRKCLSHQIHEQSQM